jgi:hypothetical protein
MKVQGAESGMYSGWDGVQKWLEEQGMKNPIICYDKCLNKSGNCVEK